MALHIVYYSFSFKEALFKAVALGGDADSLGSVVGILCGSFYGLEDDIRKLYLEKVT